MQVDVTISIANDFSKFTGGRLKSDGEFSGEAFRDDWIMPNLKKFKKVAIDFAGTKGYGSSFLEECFGGIVREKTFGYEELTERLILFSSDPTFERYVTRSKQYMLDASKNV